MALTDGEGGGDVLELEIVEDHRLRAQTITQRCVRMLCSLKCACCATRQGFVCVKPW